jgi:hypothetical protein
VAYIHVRYRLHPPEKKERAFQDQWIKLVFIGSKLERPREQSCGRFTLFREEGAHDLKKEAEGRKKQNSFHVCFGLYREPMKAYVVHADQVRVVAVPVSGPE